MNIVIGDASAGYMRAYLLREAIHSCIVPLSHEREFTSVRLEDHRARLGKITKRLEWRSEPSFKEAWARWPMAEKGGPDVIYDTICKAKDALGGPSEPPEERCKKALEYLYEAKRQMDCTMQILGYSQDAYTLTRTTPLYGLHARENAEKEARASLHELEAELDRRSRSPAEHPPERILPLACKATEDFILMLLCLDGELQEAHNTTGKKLLSSLVDAYSDLQGQLPDSWQYREAVKLHACVKGIQNKASLHATLGKKFEKRDCAQILREASGARPDTSAVVQYTRAKSTGKDLP